MFSSPEIIRTGNNTYHVQHGTDAGLYVEFYYEAVKDEEKSEKLGRPVFCDREFIKIIPVGDKNTIICEPVTEEYKMRFANKYTAFKNQSVQVDEGTRIEEWPPLTKSQAMNLKSLSIYTVEQLANVSDANLQNIGMGGRDLRDKAKAYIGNASGNSGTMALQKQLSDALLQIQALKNQLDGFKNSGVELEKEPAKRGRKKKEVIENGEDAS